MNKDANNTSSAAPAEVIGKFLAERLLSSATTDIEYLELTDTLAFQSGKNARSRDTAMAAENHVIHWRLE